MGRHESMRRDGALRVHIVPSTSNSTPRSCWKSAVMGRRRLLPITTLLLASCSLVSHTRVVDLGAFAASPTSEKKEARELHRRRDAAMIGLGTSTVAAGVLNSNPLPATAGGVVDIIAEARKKAREEKNKPGIWNPDTFKVNTQNFNATNLQGFLPTVLLVRRSYATILVQLENPKINITSPITYQLLREQNRIEPNKLLRRDAFRTKLWLFDQKKQDAAQNAYNRLMRSVDDADVQWLVISRNEGLVDKSAVRVAKKNVEAVMDCIDILVDLVPQEELDIAQTLADTKSIPVLKLPVADRYKRTGNNTVAFTEDEPIPGTNLIEVNETGRLSERLLANLTITTRKSSDK